MTDNGLPEDSIGYPELTDVQKALTSRENARLSFLKRVQPGEDGYDLVLNPEDRELLRKLAHLVGY